MKGKLKKSLIAILTLAMIFTGLAGNTVVVRASVPSAIDLSERLSNEQLAIVPGETKTMRIPIKAIGDTVINPAVTVSSSNAPFTLSQVTLTKADLTPTYDILTIGSTYVNFDITVKETAKIGNYTITIKVVATDRSGFEPQNYELTLPIEVQVVKEAAPAQLVIDRVSIKDAFISSKTNISFYVKNVGDITARNTYMTLDYGTTNIVADYVTPKIKVGDLKAGEEEFFSLPIKILSTATVGLKTVGINLDYKDVDGAKFTDTSQIYINVKKNEKAPDLQVEKLSFSKELKPGAEVEMRLTLHNYGSKDATNVMIKVDEATTGSDGLLKNYFTDSVFAGSADKDETIVAKIPMKVANSATSGNKKLNLILEFDDEEGNTFTSTLTIYPEVIGGGSSGDSDLVIENVKQMPEQPVAGDTVQVSFDLKNKSQSDIAEIKLVIQNLDGSTFIPKESEPYIYVEKLAAGKTKRINMNLTVSDKIPEGLNNLTIKYTYAGNSTGETVTIPVRNIKNDLGSGSKPKLIIGNFSVDKDELRAGSTFDLTLDIYNTHSSVAAKNITVTLTQADNIFTVAQGSNSFFIPYIGAGEQAQKTITLKVKADAMTKAYPVKIVIEYEYEGIKPNPETGEVGVTRTEELNLQAIENARPELNNINIYSWDGNVVVGGTATLGFEFYNLGKSQLNNVTISVGGDFTKTDGDVKYIGNVAAGTPYYDEFEVTPNVEGTAKAILTVTFEDSNGDEVSFTKEYTTQVMPPMDFSNMMPGPDSMGAFNPMPMAKKPILPVWGFILLEIALAAIFVPVTRKIVISLYKAKLRKQENEQF